MLRFGWRYTDDTLLYIANLSLEEEVVNILSQSLSETEQTEVKLELVLCLHQSFSLMGKSTHHRIGL